MINRRLIARITVGLVPVAAAVVLFADSNSLSVKIRDDCDPVTFTAAGHTNHVMWAPQYLEIQKRSVKWLLNQI